MTHRQDLTIIVRFAMGLLLISALAFPTGLARAASLIVNGSFEQGPAAGSYTNLVGGTTSITGWVVTGEGIDYIGTLWVHADGAHSLDLDGSAGSTISPPYSHGGIAQTFATTPGTSYVVTFSMAGNPLNLPLIKPMRVSAAGQQMDFTFDVTGKNAVNMGWVTKSWTFTANDVSTTLEFRSLTVSPSTGWGPAIDNVSVTGADTSKVLPQLAFGGGWYSALYFTNTGTSAVSFPVNFVADNGAPLNVASVGGSSATVNLAPRGTAIIEASNSGPLSQGYVGLSLPAGVTGYGVFRQSVPGTPDQEAVVPLSGASSTTSTLIWDDTSFTTAVAIVNPSSTATTVTITVRGSTGATLGTSTVPLGPKSKTAVVLRDLAGLGGMTGNRGSADFTVTSGNVAVLGLRFGESAFTSIPAADR